jgi:hypothetical protein
METKSLIARVDISKLGWMETLDRHLKEPYTQRIMVKGKVPTPNTYERGTWPQQRTKSGFDTPLYVLKFLELTLEFRY